MPLSFGKHLKSLFRTNRRRRNGVIPVVADTQKLEDRMLLAAQSIASDVTTQQVAVGDTVTVPVIYQTLDDSGNPAVLQTNLLSFNLHFDSEELEFVGVSSVFQEGAQVLPDTVRSESDPTSNADDDPDTDSILVASYSDSDPLFNPGWPNDLDADGLQLYLAEFTVKPAFDGSEIHFTANARGNIVGQPEQFDFQSTSLELSLAQSDLPAITGPVGASENLRPTITWTAATDAVSYELWLERLGDTGNPVVNPTVDGLSYTLTEDLGVGRYRAWVRANLTSGDATPWVTGDFQVNPAPVIADLPFHADDLTPTISWTAVPGAVGYRVFSANLTAEGPAVIDQIVTDTSYTPTENFEFGRHRIWVRALGPGNYGATWSAAQSYYVGPDITGPVRSTFDLQPTFEWESLPDIASYQLLVMKGSQIVINETGINSTSYTPAAPLELGDHRWWIRPSHTNGNVGTWSELGTFYAGGRPTLTGPVGTSTDATPTITWEAVEGAGSYEVYVFNDDGEGVLQRISDVEGTSFTTIPVPDGNYRVWLRSYEADGSVGLWSRPISFVVDAASSDLQATPLTPTTPTFEVRPEFTWEATSGANFYDIYLTDGQTTLRQDDVTGTSWTPSSDLSSGQWQWWLRAKSGSGNTGAGAWSAVQTTDTTGRAVILSADTAAGDTTIVWTAVIGATSYSFQLDNLTTGENSIIREDGLTGSEYTTSGLASGEYRAWVRAFGSSAAPWSLRFEFSV